MVFLFVSSTVVVLGVTVVVVRVGRAGRSGLSSGVWSLCASGMRFTWLICGLVPVFVVLC